MQIDHNVPFPHVSYSAVPLNSYEILVSGKNGDGRSMNQIYAVQEDSTTFYKAYSFALEGYRLDEAVPFYDNKILATAYAHGNPMKLVSFTRGATPAIQVL